MRTRTKGTIVQLPDFTTRTRQTAHFQPVCKLPGNVVLGILEIHQSINNKDTTTRYLVEELSNIELSIKDSSRSFRLTQSQNNKTRRDGDANCHYIRIIYDTPRPPAWDEDSCSCAGFIGSGRCKHHASIRVLAIAGAFRPERGLPVFPPKIAPHLPERGKGKGKILRKPRKRKDGAKNANKRKRN